MYLLQIEHPVPSFDRWKEAFDSDPVGRQQERVRSHRIFRKIDDPTYVIIELEFDQLSEAESFLISLQKLWGKVEGTVMNSPRARIVEVVESKEY